MQDYFNFIFEITKKIALIEKGLRDKYKDKYINKNPDLVSDNSIEGQYRLVTIIRKAIEKLQWYPAYVRLELITGYEIELHWEQIERLVNESSMERMSTEELIESLLSKIPDKYEMDGVINNIANYFNPTTEKLVSFVTLVNLNLDGSEDSMKRFQDSIVATERSIATLNDSLRRYYLSFQKAKSNGFYLPLPNDLPIFLRDRILSSGYYDAESSLVLDSEQIYNIIKEFFLSFQENFFLIRDNYTYHSLEPLFDFVHSKKNLLNYNLRELERFLKERHLGKFKEGYLPLDEIQNSREKYNFLRFLCEHTPFGYFGKLNDKQGELFTIYWNKVSEAMDEIYQWYVNNNKNLEGYYGFSIDLESDVAISVQLESLSKARKVAYNAVNEFMKSASGLEYDAKKKRNETKKDDLGSFKAVFGEDVEEFFIRDLANRVLRSHYNIEELIALFYQKEMVEYVQREFQRHIRNSDDVSAILDALEKYYSWKKMAASGQEEQSTFGGFTYSLKGKNGQ